VTAHGDASYLDIFKSSMKNPESWDWTYTSSQSNSTGTSETATVTVGGPVYGYTGPTDMSVYYDVVYKTFAFAPIQGQPLALKGTLIDANAKPLFGAEISVVANGVQTSYVNEHTGRMESVWNHEWSVRIPDRSKK
jgi:hypothetical protein